MGSLLSRLVEKLASKLFTQCDFSRILLLGLDGAGKTTIIYKLKLGEYVNAVPTIGFNVEVVKYKGLNMNIWDVGGQDKIRSLWKHYYTNTTAIIFVVDSCDEERLDIAKNELYVLLGAEELKDAILLVLVNKRDIGKLTAADITTKFELEKVERRWKVQDTCATTGDGLYEGLDWLYENLHRA